MRYDVCWSFDRGGRERDAVCNAAWNDACNDAVWLARDALTRFVRAPVSGNGCSVTGTLD